MKKAPGAASCRILSLFEGIYLTPAHPQPVERCHHLECARGVTSGALVRGWACVPVRERCG